MGGDERTRSMNVNNIDELVRKIEQLEQQLAQAQAALRYAVAVCRFSRSHSWPVCPSSDFAEFSTLLDALDTKLRAAGLIEQVVKQADSPSMEYDEALCEKLQGWLSPGEAKRLEADAAAMRVALEDERSEIIRGGRHHVEERRMGIINSALSTTAGRSLLERLERYEKALEYYKDKFPHIIKALEALKGDKP